MDRDRAEQIADAIFKDIRGRKSLKWMLVEHVAGMDPIPIIHERDGTPLSMPTEQVQGEMREEWIALLMQF